MASELFISTMKRFLISESKLAGASGIDVKTMKRYVSGESVRTSTKQKIWKGLNRALEEIGEHPVSSDIMAE